MQIDIAGSQLLKTLGLIFGLVLFAPQAFTKSTSQMNKPEVQIVALSPNLVETVFEIGAGEQLVGVSAHSDFPELAKKLPVVSDFMQINIEKIVTLKPDLVIAWQGVTPNKGVSQLVDLGLRVEWLKANSFVEYIKSIERLGRLIGREQTANRLSNTLMTKFVRLQKQNSSIELKSGFIEIWPEPLTTATTNTIVDQAVSICGVNNVFKAPESSYPQISLESLLVLPIDIIIQPISALKPTNVKDWNKFQSISAVSNNAIVQPNSDALFRWSPRWIYEVDRLCAEVQKLKVKS